MKKTLFGVCILSFILLGGCTLLQKISNPNVSTFSDTEIWVSFSYPSNWWEITKSSEENDGKKYLIGLSKDKENIFAVFHNGGTPVARWGFWWDMAMNISGSAYVSSFCTGKTKCTVHTNSNDIPYVKYYYEAGVMGSEQTKSTIAYYLFNPNSDFRGIIVSNDRIPNEPESSLDTIVESFKFITTLATTDCKKEWEISNGSLGPKQYQPCCSGLQEFDRKNYGSSNWSKVVWWWVLCYNPQKWTPVCEMDWIQASSWYYPNGWSLLKNDSACKDFFSDIKDHVDAIAEKVKSTVYDTIDSITQGVWDKKVEVTLTHDSQKATKGFWWATDKWDWIAYEKEDGDRKVIVSKNGFNCDEIDAIPTQYVDFFKDVTYQLGKKHCYTKNETE